MQKFNDILLPGLNEQINFLLNAVDITNFKILVIGTETISVAKTLCKKCNNNIEVIVEDYDSYIEHKIQLVKNENIYLKLMDFEHTDFADSQFDIVYAQASISNLRRNKIVKEILRVLKRNGIFCVGEVIKTQTVIPIFVQDIFNNSNLSPLFSNELEKYYTNKNFEVLGKKDLSFTLKNYYSTLSKLSKKSVVKLNENEKSYYKKLINQVKHESHAFLSLGANKYMGFETLLLRKNEKK